MGTVVKTWQDVPGWFDYMDLYNQAVDEGKDGDTFVEVGSFLGKSASYLAGRIQASGKAIKLICVDNWAHPDYPGWWNNVKNWVPPPCPLPTDDLLGKEFPEAFAHVINTLGYADIVSLMKLPSVEAAACFGDKSLAFVFIDADHLYEGIRDDIAAWRDKVKFGGVLSGHDYRVQMWPGVERAVDEQFSGSVEHRNPNSWFVRM
jgi:hypothetical protein